MSSCLYDPAKDWGSAYLWLAIDSHHVRLILVLAVVFSFCNGAPKNSVSAGVPLTAII